MPRGRKTSRPGGTVTRSGVGEKNSTTSDHERFSSPRRSALEGDTSPSPTTPPKMKKTPVKRSPQRTPGSGGSPNKITNYFSPLAEQPPQIVDLSAYTPPKEVRPKRHAEKDVVVYAEYDEDDDLVEEDEIVYATPEELEEDGCSGCEDSGSGKENEDWRAIGRLPSPIHNGQPGLEKEAIGAKPKKMAGSGDIRTSTAPGETASSNSPLQPRRVITRSHTAKIDLESPPRIEVLPDGLGKLNPSSPVQKSSPLFTLTNGVSSNRSSIKTPPHSPPTPHKIKLVEERRRTTSSNSSNSDASKATAAIAQTTSTVTNGTTAKKILSFSPKKVEIKVKEEVEVKMEEAEADVSRVRRNLNRILDDNNKNVVQMELKSKPTQQSSLTNHGRVNGVVNGMAGQKKPKSNKNNDRLNGKVTDYFPIRRSERKPKTEIAAKQQSEIEIRLSKSINDTNLGIAVKFYEGKGRGVEALKKFSKGDFVVEYAGDLMEGTAAAKIREEKYAADAATGCYMYYFKHGDKHYCIDATAETGRLGRLVNHSRLKPNCQTRVVLVKDVPRLILVAKTDIEPGTELPLRLWG